MRAKGNLFATARLLVVAAALTVLVVGPSADAAFPGANGQVVFHTDRDGNSEIYVMDPAGTSAVNLTNHSSTDFWPAISPNGTEVVFASNREGDHEIYTVNIDGSGLTRLTASPGHDLYPSWSPDGLHIVFVSARDGNQ